MDDLVERALDRRQRREPFDQLITPLHCLAALDGLTVAIDWPRAQIAVAVGERLEQLRRKRMGEIVEDIFARGDVDLDVVPLLRRDLGEPTLHQRLAGRDDLDNAGMPGGKVRLGASDQRRRLHRCKQMTEEALLRPFERRSRGGFGLRIERRGATILAGLRHAGGLQRRVEILVDNLERAGIGVVDANLLRRQRMLDDLIFDAVIG